MLQAAWLACTAVAFNACGLHTYDSVDSGVHLTNFGARRRFWSGGFENPPYGHGQSFVRARSSNNARSRAFVVIAAARVNSARASSLLPSFSSKSPRTLGSHW